MPLATERLDKDSGKEAVRSAISSCISQGMHEGGRELRQVVAMCMNSAREHAGARFVPRRVRVRRKLK